MSAPWNPQSEEQQLDDLVTPDPVHPPELWAMVLVLTLGYGSGLVAWARLLGVYGG